VSNFESMVYRNWTNAKPADTVWVGGCEMREREGKKRVFLLGNVNKRCKKAEQKARVGRDRGRANISEH
jgi:hypothetical protein